MRTSLGEMLEIEFSTLRFCYCRGVECTQKYRRRYNREDAPGTIQPQCDFRVVPDNAYLQSSRYLLRLAYQCWE